MPPGPKGSGAEHLSGIVRDMDVAHEAYRDVLAAVPPTDPGAAAAPSAVCLTGLPLSAQLRFSTST